MEMREKKETQHEKCDEKLAINVGAKCELKSSAADLKQSSKRKPVNFPIALHSNGLEWNFEPFCK
jgi:hypothetical protein